MARTKLLLLQLQPPDVFFSYNWGTPTPTGAYDNQERAKALKEIVEGRQIKCWLDLEQMASGDNLRLAMSNGIDEANAVVILLTPLYVTSGNCMREYEWARAGKKKVILLAMHPYTTAGNKSKFGTEADRAEGGLKEVLSTTQRDALVGMLEEFLYFDFSSAERQAGAQGDFVRKLLHTVAEEVQAKSDGQDSDAVSLASLFLSFARTSSLPHTDPWEI